ncbi:MAG: hypothetical protein U0736_07130 [Gemmataceae bacterium]
MFDKHATASRLSAAGIPVPPSLPPPATPAELIDAVRGQRFPTAYVKLNTGSSASAIAVLHPARQPWAVSTLTRIDGEYYSTRRLLRLQGEPLDATLAFLLREAACAAVSRWHRWTSRTSTRVVMIRGRPACTVFRLSSGPMTNLHLGAKRGPGAVSCGDPDPRLAGRAGPLCRGFPTLPIVDGRHRPAVRGRLSAALSARGERLWRLLPALDRRERPKRASAGDRIDRTGVWAD